MNYKDHCEEMGLPLPELPFLFNKYPSNICTNGEVHVPDHVTRVRLSIPQTDLILYYTHACTK